MSLYRRIERVERRLRTAADCPGCRTDPVILYDAGDRPADPHRCRLCGRTAETVIYLPRRSEVTPR